MGVYSRCLLWVSTLGVYFGCLLGVAILSVYSEHLLWVSTLGVYSGCLGLEPDAPSSGNDVTRWVAPDLGVYSGCLLWVSALGVYSGCVWTGCLWTGWPTPRPRGTTCGCTLGVYSWGSTLGVYSGCLLWVPLPCLLVAVCLWRFACGDSAEDKPRDRCIF